tara:strand:+ start:3102 stop:3311 length:210 start_codon:yes stop_codon:yes gene_type:complete
MPSLDGYSLNEKIDKKFEELNEEIKVLKFRLDTEMGDFKNQFNSLTKVINNQIDNPEKKQRKKIEKKEK